MAGKREPNIVYIENKKEDFVRNLLFWSQQSESNRRPTDSYHYNFRCHKCVCGPDFLFTIAFALGTPYKVSTLDIST